MCVGALPVRSPLHEPLNQRRLPSLSSHTRVYFMSHFVPDERLPHQASDESNAIMAAGNRRYEPHQCAHPFGEQYKVFHFTSPHCCYCYCHHHHSESRPDQTSTARKVSSFQKCLVYIQ